ncbi:MAG: SDR family oxidoreductase [Bacteroidota bacterium]|nr:SDR family oxidoreductase [Bacteroidota bacterium]
MMLVIVTGASKGIGFEIVKLFLNNPNYSIIAISRNIDSLTKLVNANNTTNLIPFKADITNSKQHKKVVDLIKKIKLPVGILINNAGQIVNKPFEKISEKELESVYNTNVFGPFKLIQQLLPFFGKKAKSHIVNISSMGGFQGSSKFAGLSAYSSSKSALSGLTECLAEEFKDKNIAVNCLAIGAVQTEMLNKAFPGYKAPLQPKQMATFIYDFAINGHNYFNGKILPVSLSTP